MKKIIAILILIIVSPSLANAQSVREAYRKWTYRLSTSGTSVGRMKIDATMISDDLMQAWIQNADSDGERSRIQEIYGTAQEEGLVLFIVKIRMRSNKEFVYADFSDIRNNAMLFIGDNSGHGAHPLYYSGNANTRLYGGQDYYAFLAFQMHEDPFSFKSLQLSGNYVNESILQYNQRRNPKRPRICQHHKDFQFAYLPFGVEESKRPGSTPDAGDIFSMLRLALKIMTRFI